MRNGEGEASVVTELLGSLEGSDCAAAMMGIVDAVIAFADHQREHHSAKESVEYIVKDILFHQKEGGSVYQGVSMLLTLRLLQREEQGKDNG